MSMDVTIQSNNHQIISENNNIIENLNEINTYKIERFSLSSDSDYMEHSRSNSTNSEKNSSLNEKSSHSKPMKSVESSQKDNSNIIIKSSYSPSVKSVDKSDGNASEVLDSGISSPNCNFVCNLDANKTEKPISNKDKLIENINIESPNDNSGSKGSNSKFPFRLPKLHVTPHNSSNINGIVNRIRSLSISLTHNSNNRSRRTSCDGSSLPSEYTTLFGITSDIGPNPTKLQKENLTSSIQFTNKNLRSNRKWLRLTHSLSCDAESYMPEFTATQNRLEKHLSGQLDASTPNGALLKLINQGLRKVSESDRYLLFSKSPLRCPIDFLESGIEHLGDTEILITVFHHSTCYDLMPESGKVIVFDSKIQISKAFVALDDNSIDSAPIWCDTSHSFCGMLNKEDKIHFLFLVHQLKDDNNEIKTKIENWSKETVENCLEKDSIRHEFHSVYPESTVASAIKQLKHSPCNKVLVIDEHRSGNALFVLDHGLILSFLLNASKAGLPLPSVLKTAVGVTELMVSRKLLDKYYVFPDTEMRNLIETMNENSHHCALVCTEASNVKTCSCKYDCITVITVDHITHLISTSMFSDPSISVQSILEIAGKVNQKLIRCTESDSIIDIIKYMNKEKATLVLISQDSNKKCIHSIISAKELLDYIMKHDHTRSSSRDSVFTIDKSKSFRSISCCEDSQRNNDTNLSELSLDEKDEDVFNMEMI